MTTIKQTIEKIRALPYADSTIRVCKCIDGQGDYALCKSSDLKAVADAASNLAMLVRSILASKHFADCSLKTRAGDYLVRKDLQGSPLRENALNDAEGGEG